MVPYEPGIIPNSDWPISEGDQWKHWDDNFPHEDNYTNISGAVCHETEVV